MGGSDELHRGHDLGIADGVDFDLALQSIEEKRLPALKGFGATSVTIVKTSQRTSMAITEWPDMATRDAAELKIDEVRRAVDRDDRVRMTGEMKGEIIAEI